MTVAMQSQTDEKLTQPRAPCGLPMVLVSLTHTPAEFFPTRQDGAASLQFMVSEETGFFNIHFSAFQHALSPFSTWI
jgi:hypothetical protein